MEILVTVAVVGLAFIFFGKGLADGRAGSPITISMPTDGKDVANCQEASVKWDNARQMQCNAKADEEAARTRAAGIRAKMLVFTASAAALSIAGGATLTAAWGAAATILGIPLAKFLFGVAAALFILAAAAQTAAADFAGQLISAESDASAKSTARSAWDTEVAKARNEVNMKCTLAEANTTLSRTAPC